MSERKYTIGEAGFIAAVVAFLMPLMFVAVFPITIFCAWCDLWVWNWFAAPYFQLPPLSLWVSLGLGLWIRSQVTSYKTVEGEKIKFRSGLVNQVLGHALMLLTGYLIHRYVFHF